MGIQCHLHSWASNGPVDWARPMANGPVGLKQPVGSLACRTCPDGGLAASLYALRYMPFAHDALASR
jgi:hypothetical protein